MFHRTQVTNKILQRIHIHSCSADMLVVLMWSVVVCGFQALSTSKSALAYLMFFCLCS